MSTTASKQIKSLPWRSRSQKRLKQVVAPLLQGIAEQCGWDCVSLICGANDPTRMVIATVHHGTIEDTVEQDIERFDADGFQGHVYPQYSKFLAAMAGK